MPPKKANKVPRRWRPAERPGRHIGRSLAAAGLAGVVLVGGVSWAVSGGDVLEGSSLSLGDRRTVTADGDAGERPSSAAAVPVAFEGDPTTTATTAAPSTEAPDPEAGAADEVGEGATTSEGPAVTADAAPAPRPDGWLLRPLAPTPGPTITPVADSTTTSSTTTSTRPTTTSSSSTTTSTSTTSTTSTTTPPTSDTTPEVEPTSTTDDDGTTTSSSTDDTTTTSDG